MKLTKREQDVLVLLLKGMSNKEIGRAMGISDGTVKVHLTSIFDKSKIRSRVKLMAAMNKSTEGKRS
jgi:DNA-binding NarL/FixJ family response regulator